MQPYHAPAGRNVTLPDMPEFGRVSLIDVSAFDAGTPHVSARLPLLDDFRSHVWSTEDYGETWTRIVDGIRDDAYVNLVREDPNREGLLYAGTNHGVYVTFDDGGWWWELTPGLPDMPVTDVIPEQDEVVLAWWVGEGVGSAQEAKLDVIDATSQVVRAIEPAGEAEERDRWSGPTLPWGPGSSCGGWEWRRWWWVGVGGRFREGTKRAQSCGQVGGLGTWEAEG